MEKVYFCRQRNNGTECGETDPSKFPEGRYSACKECRKRFIREYNKGVKEDAKLDRKIAIEERIVKSKTMEEFGENAVKLFVKIIETYPIGTIGIALPVKIDEIETVIDQNYARTMHIGLDNEKDIESLRKENRNLKKENEEIREQNSKLFQLHFQLEERYKELEKRIIELEKK